MLRHDPLQQTEIWHAEEDYFQGKKEKSLLAHTASGS